ncbi:MAG TPA: Spy/CpxP family protein refolding chaperone [Vicinamibacteria bacterium]|nr:Spy/CpxP family protein refolding chaperone [Vicinamibacteria bacterium]
MTRTIKWVGAAALALGLAGAGFAGQDERGFGEGPKGGRMHGRHHGFGRAMRELNLTDAQKEQLKQMHEQQREALRPVMEQQRQLRQQIREALEAGNPDATRIGQLEIQAHQLRQQLKAEREKAHAAFVNVLTPEQKAQWEKMKNQRHERMEKFREQRQQRQQERES